MKRAIFLALALAGPAYAQGVIPSDATALQAQIDAANAKASTALTKANGAVQSVGGNMPDGSGNVSLPSTFSGTTCVSCTMSNIALTGTASLNGSALATTSALSGYATTGALSAVSTVANAAAPTSVLTSYVKTVNGISPTSGNVALTIPAAYTDAQAVAANSSAISTAVAPLATSSSVTAEATTRAANDASEVTARNAAIAAANPIKYAKANLASTSAGVFTVTMPANLFVNSPVVVVEPRAAGIGSYVATTGTAATGFTITVTFWKLAATVAALGGSITATITSPVNFDITASEPTA